jgi:hypothetical protein
MTVKELIVELQKFPEDTVVIRNDDLNYEDGGLCMVEFVTYEHRDEVWSYFSGGVPDMPRYVRVC